MDVGERRREREEGRRERKEGGKEEGKRRKERGGRRKGREGKIGREQEGGNYKVLEGIGGLENTQHHIASHPTVGRSLSPVHH